MKTQKNIPALRFPEFKGEWKVDRLINLTEMLRCGIAATPDYVEVGIPFLSAQNVTKEGVISLHKYSFISEKYYKELSKNHKLKKGDILYSRVGAGFGTAAIFPFDGEYGVYVSLTHIRANSKLKNPFLKFYLNSELGKKQASNGVFQGGGVPNLNVKVVEKFRIPHPTLPEQQKIASFLSAVDEKIQQLTRKAALLEQYKKGVMQQLFSGALRFKNYNGEEYPEWEEKKLGEVLKIGSGKDYKHLEKGNIPVFGTGGYMLSVNKFLYKGETVFIGRKGTIDKPFYFNGEFWTVDTLFYTHTFKNVNPKFIFCVFQQINWKLHNEASGVPSLSKSTIESLKFDFPCLEEQQKIAGFLSGIDEKKAETNGLLEKNKEFKKGLLQGMFV